MFKNLVLYHVEPMKSLNRNETREQAVILMPTSISTASGTTPPAERNRSTILYDRCDELETQYGSPLESHTETQKRLESEIAHETLKIALAEEEIPTFSPLTHNTTTGALSKELIEDVDLTNRRLQAPP